MPVPMITTVSAHFDEAMFHTVTFILASADRALHHHIRTFRQGSREFRQLPERNNSVPVCSALPVDVGILPGFFRRDRKRDNQRAVRCVVSFGIRAGETIIVIWFMVYI